MICPEAFDDTQVCKYLGCEIKFTPKKALQVYCSPECWIRDNPDLVKQKIEDLI